MTRLIETEIQDLKVKVLDMAELVRVQLEHCSQALNVLDYDLAKRVLKKEKDVDKYDNKIQKRCERIIALYQPVANDLRFVFSVLKINQYLEQVGDSLSGISFRILDIRKPFDPALISDLRVAEMQEACKAILYEALRSYFRENVDQAKTIFQKDDLIDEIHEKAFPIIVTAIQKNPAQTAEFMQLYQIIRNLEKIGDYSVAIAEESLFYTEGVVYRHSELKHAHKAHENDTAAGVAIA